MTGIPFSRLDQATVAELVTSGPVSPGFRTVITCNLDHLHNLGQNSALRDAYRNAWLVTIDGTPLHIYASRCKRLTIPKVTGADLFPEILRRLRPGVDRPFFVVSRAATGVALIDLLRQRGFEPSTLLAEAPAFGFEGTGDAGRQLLAAVQDHNTTHLFMGVGSPKSEVWLNRHRRALGAMYAFGFGAALDFAAGTVPRAPHWMQRAGLEWLHRIGRDPRRLVRRYGLNALSFTRLIIADQLSGGSYLI